MAKVTSITDVYPIDSDFKKDEMGKLALDEHGFVIPDRASNADALRDVMRTFFSNGVFADRGDELAVTSSGGTWRVGTGVAMADGLRIPVKEPAEVIGQEEIGAGEYAYVCIAGRFETHLRDGGIYPVVTSSPAYDPVRDGSTYELVLARIDWRGTMTDYRLDPSMCGVAAPFESIDTDSFMLELYTAVSQFDLNVGEVLSLPSGSTPEVVVRKPTMAGGDVYIDFGIPRGAPGESGQSAPGLYIQQERPANPSEGTMWMGTDPSTRQIEHIEAYEVTGTYPGEVYPGEAYPGGTAAWAAYTINPALIAGNQS